MIFGLLDYVKEHLLKLIYSVMLVFITINTGIHLSPLSPNKTSLLIILGFFCIAFITFVLTSIKRTIVDNKVDTTNNDTNVDTNVDTKNPINETEINPSK